MLAPAFTRRLALALLLLAPFSFASRPWTEEGTQATFNADGTISIDPEEGFT